MKSVRQKAQDNHWIKYVSRRHSWFLPVPQIFYPEICISHKRRSTGHGKLIWRLNRISPAVVCLRHGKKGKKGKKEGWDWCNSKSQDIKWQPKKCVWEVCLQKVSSSRAAHPLATLSLATSIRCMLFLYVLKCFTLCHWYFCYCFTCPRLSLPVCYS